METAQEDHTGLADEPVYCEPVSAPNSLITGKNTGNCAKLSRLRRRKPRIVPMQSAFLIQFPAHPNREFPKRQQGKKASRTGKVELRLRCCPGPLLSAHLDVVGPYDAPIGRQAFRAKAGPDTYRNRSVTTLTAKALQRGFLAPAYGGGLMWRHNCRPNRHCHPASAIHYRASRSAPSPCAHFACSHNI